MQETRVCTACGVRKDIENFWPKRADRFKQCRQCMQARRKDQKSYLRKRRFGLSEEEFFALLDEQDGVCAICKEECITGRNLAVDHNHASGMVRGLLCSRCNQGLGLFKDDPELLATAIEYLQKFPALQGR